MKDSSPASHPEDFSGLDYERYKQRFEDGPITLPRGSFSFENAKALLDFCKAENGGNHFRYNTKPANNQAFDECVAGLKMIKEMKKRK